MLGGVRTTTSRVILSARPNASTCGKVRCLQLVVPALPNSSPRRGLSGAVAPKAPKLSLDNVNPKVKRTSYAVRGAVLDASFAIQKRLESGEKVGLGYDSLAQLNVVSK
jgi:hypothetical protein